MSEMFTLRIPEQKSLAKTALHVEQINFGKMPLKKLKIQLHFLPLRRKIRTFACNCCRKYIHHVGFI